MNIVGFRKKHILVLVERFQNYAKSISIIKCQSMEKMAQAMNAGSVKREKRRSKASRWWHH